MLHYPVWLVRNSNGSFLVRFVDFQEANSVGDKQRVALTNAVDALATMLEIYFDERRAIPTPSQCERQHLTVSLPALETAKVQLWNAMIAQNVSKADWARMLNVHMPQIDRLFDLKHSSKIEFVEQAAKALGKSLVVSLACASKPYQVGAGQAMPVRAPARSRLA